MFRANSISLFRGLAVAIGLGSVPMAIAAPVEPAVSQCIRFDLIDHTKVIDDSTILFYLKGGRVLANKLDAPCNGLRFNTKGISYVVHGDDEVCGNLQIFKVRDFGTVCSLGTFSAYQAPPVSR